MLIQASKIAGCVGAKSKYEKSSEGWLNVLYSNFPVIMQAYGSADSFFKKKQERVNDELKNLGIDERTQIKQVIKSCVGAEKNDIFRGDHLPSGLSLEATSEIQSSIHRLRGTKQEKEGMTLMNKNDAAQAQEHLRKVQAARNGLERAEKESVDSLLEVAASKTRSEDEKAAEMKSIQERLMLKKRQLDEVVNTENQRARIASANVTTQLSLRTSLHANPSLTLVGKLDGLKASAEEIEIREHKRRQRNIFRYVPLYEKIQCLAYMHLVEERKAELFLDDVTGQIHWRSSNEGKPCTKKNDDGSPKATTTALTEAHVKCYLVQSFGLQEERTEIEFDAFQWQDITDILIEQTTELILALKDRHKLAAVLKRFDEEAELRWSKKNDNSAGNNNVFSPSCSSSSSRPYLPSTLPAAVIEPSASIG